MELPFELLLYADSAISASPGHPVLWIENLSLVLLTENLSLNERGCNLQRAD
jgi:hypothetical protein